jgi:hypothetical protein
MTRYCKLLDPCPAAALRRTYLDANLEDELGLGAGVVRERRDTHLVYALNYKLSRKYEYHLSCLRLNPDP